MQSLEQMKGEEGSKMEEMGGDSGQRARGEVVWFCPSYNYPVMAPSLCLTLSLSLSLSGHSVILFPKFIHYLSIYLSLPFCVCVYTYIDLALMSVINFGYVAYIHMEICLVSCLNFTLLFCLHNFQ